MTTPLGLNAGLVGCGYWGPNLLRNLYNLGFRVPLVADSNEARREWVNARYPASRSVASWREIVDSRDIAAVLVATPPQTHYEIAKAALESGKHVLVEKPMALTSAHCRELIGIAKRRNLVLMTDHVYVYTAAVRKMRELIVNGELGTLYYYDSVRVNLGLFQTHVNVLWDLGPHDLSIVDYLVGGMKVDSLSAAGTRMPGTEHHYQAYMNMLIEGGFGVNVHLNWLSPVKVRKIIVAGEKRMMVFDETDAAEQLKVYDRGFAPVSVEEKHRTLGTYRMGNMVAPHLDGVEALQRLLGQFGDCIAGGAEPDAGAEQGLRVVEAIERAQEFLDRSVGK